MKRLCQMEPVPGEELVSVNEQVQMAALKKFYER